MNTPVTTPVNPTMATRVRPALVLFLLLGAVTGLVYPLLVTGAAQALFPAQARGSLLTHAGAVVGSDLVGQSFTDPRHFWGRPSATATTPYNAMASGGSNLGPLNPVLTDAVKARIAALRQTDPGNSAPAPIDLVTASASGLDPHITLAAARYQVPRVARLRGLAPDRVTALVEQQAEGPIGGVLGESRINVLRLNLALESMR